MSRQGRGDGLGGTNKTGADLNGLPRLNAPVIVYFREITKVGLLPGMVSRSYGQRVITVAAVQLVIAGKVTEI